MGGSYVQSDDAEVADVLQRIVSLVLANGGELHPSAVLTARSGNLSIECADEAKEDEILVRIPASLLIPVGDLEVDPTPSHLSLSGASEHLSAVQRELLDLHIELYNTTNKIPLMCQTHPALRLRHLPEAVAAIKDLQPRFQGFQRSAGEVFLATRTLASRKRVPKQPDDANPGQRAKAARVIMPLIDLLNHHPNGAPFRSEQAGLRVKVRRGAGGQCYAKYNGRTDVLHMALSYAYLDPNVREAVSTRVEVLIPGVGTIRVLGQHPMRSSAIDPPQNRGNV